MSQRNHRPGRQDWTTPGDLLVRIPWEFDLDAAADESNTICETWLGPGGVAEDATEVRWSDYGRTIWCNPPYAGERACAARCKKKRCEGRGYCLSKNRPGSSDFLRKAVEAHADGCTVVMLLPVATGTRWFARWASKGRIIFLRGRLRFDEAAPADFDSMLIVFEAGKALGDGERLSAWLGI